jgi:hypothetical protein
MPPPAPLNATQRLLLARLDAARMGGPVNSVDPLTVIDLQLDGTPPDERRPAVTDQPDFTQIAADFAANLTSSRRSMRTRKPALISFPLKKRRAMWGRRMLLTKQ